MTKAMTKEEARKLMLFPELVAMLESVAVAHEAYASEGNGMTPRVCEKAYALLADIKEVA